MFVWMRASKHGTPSTECLPASLIRPLKTIEWHASKSAFESDANLANATNRWLRLAAFERNMMLYPGLAYIHHTQIQSMRARQRSPERHHQPTVAGLSGTEECHVVDCCQRGEACMVEPMAHSGCFPLVSASCRPWSNHRHIYSKEGKKDGLETGFEAKPSKETLALR